MTKVKAFKAFIYNQDKIGDLAATVCPPYDIISPSAQQRYHDLSPYNFVHVLFRKDIPGEDRYLSAGHTFRDWLKNGVLVRDPLDTIYFYSQEYTLKGEKRTRLGFISLLRLHNHSQGIFGHEHTRLGPKEDRLKLLREVKANLSPIFAIFLDKKRIIQRIYRKYIQAQRPFIDIVDEDRIAHKVWRLDSADALKVIGEGMSEEDIFIADGHHRYEVACAYRNEMEERLAGKFTGEEDFNYILTYFTNTDPRGLSILPIHRLLKLDSPIEMQGFILRLSAYFIVEEIKDKQRFFFLMEKGGRTEHVLGLYRDKRFWLLRLKNIKILDTLIADKPREYRKLDVSILNHMVLKDILGYNLEDLQHSDKLIFSPDAEEFIGKVDGDDRCIAFFLNPVKIEEIIGVALNGNKMPPKSTYFYPKVLSGLVVNKFD